MKTRKHSVYHLVDPNTSKVRYVGNSVSPVSRLRAHVKESQEKQNTDKKKWIKSLLDRGQMPCLVIVATFDNEPDARTRESAEANKHKSTSTNIHDPAKGAKDLHAEGKKTTTRPTSD